MNAIALAQEAPSGPTLKDGYLPIAEHGIVGDLHTAALVGTDGTIDWYCVPRFDAPSVFGSILDKERGATTASPRPPRNGRRSSSTTPRRTSSSPASSPRPEWPR